MRILFKNADVSFDGRAIFVDRDGVINQRRPDDYVLQWSQFVFMPGIQEALHKLSKLRLPMIVISNQAGVGRGLLDPEILKEITLQFNEALREAGVTLAGCYYCLHRSDEGCACRKPQPGLLRRAAADFHVDLHRSIFIGDADTDVEAAQSAGCHPVLFDPNFRYSSLECMKEIPTARTTKELGELAFNLIAPSGTSDAIRTPVLKASDDHR